jgi:hypothetical protein
MDLSNDELEQYAAADRREVDPRIKVEMATWSTAGRLDLRSGRAPAVAGLGYEAKTAVNGGSELLIFVRRAAHGHDGFTEGARVGGASNQRTSRGGGCCDG